MFVNVCEQKVEPSWSLMSYKDDIAASLNIIIIHPATQMLKFLCIINVAYYCISINPLSSIVSFQLFDEDFFLFSSDSKKHILINNCCIFWSKCWVNLRKNYKLNAFRCQIHFSTCVILIKIIIIGPMITDWSLCFVSS